jgi:hypothetical protein
MLYCHRIPRPPLDSCIESIWLYQNEPRPHAFERILPTGAGQLIVNLKEDQTRIYHPDLGNRCERTSGTILSGVQSRYRVIDTAEQEYVLGVAFRPGGLVPFTRLPAHEACDADIPLDALWGHRRASDLRERLLEAGHPDAKLEAMEDALDRPWQIQPTPTAPSRPISSCAMPIAS